MAGTLTVQNLQGPSSGSNANTVLIPSGQKLYAPGHVLQVQSTNYGARLSSTSSTMVAVSGLSVNITPSSTSSKILVTATVEGSSQLYYGMFWQVRRGTSTVIMPDTSQTLSSRIESYGIYNGDQNVSITQSATYLDSPATTASTTYTVYVKGQSGASFCLNGTLNNADNSAYGQVGSSMITAMEIAQ